MNKEYPIEEELEEAYKKINELQEENERLKIQVSAREELYEYSQAKIDKAIVELKQAYTNIENNNNANYIHIAFRDDLLNILQGSDNNE